MKQNSGLEVWDIPLLVSEDIQQSEFGDSADSSSFYISKSVNIISHRVWFVSEQYTVEVGLWINKDIGN